MTDVESAILRMMDSLWTAALIIAVYFVVGMLLHLDPVIFGIPTQPSIRMGDLALLFALTASLFRRRTRKRAERGK